MRDDDHSTKPCPPSSHGRARVQEAPFKSTRIDLRDGIDIGFPPVARITRVREREREKNTRARIIVNTGASTVYTMFVLSPEFLKYYVDLLVFFSRSLSTPARQYYCH